MNAARRTKYSEEATHEAGLGSLFVGLSMMLLGVSLVPLILNSDAVTAGARWPVLLSGVIFCAALVPTGLYVVHYRRFRRIVRRDEQSRLAQSSDPPLGEE